MAQHVVDVFVSISPCPQKLLEVHREHLIIHFISYAVRLDFPVVDSHKRPRTDNVVSFVDTERLQTSGTFWAVLHLVEKEQCLPCLKLQRLVDERYVLHDAIHVISVIEYPLELLFQHEIDCHDILIVSRSKLHDG